MAWKTEVAERRGASKDEFVVVSETLYPIGDTVSSRFTSVIDFIPPGTDFAVIANTAPSNMSASGHIELFYSYDKDATIANRVRSNVTPFKPVTAEVDNATKWLVRDVSAQGQYPYYWLKFATGTDSTTGGTGGASMIIKVLYGAPGKEKTLP